MGKKKGVLGSRFFFFFFFNFLGSRVFIGLGL